MSLQKSNLKLCSLRSKKKKRMKKGYKIDGSPLRDTIYVSPESQKEKKGRREQKGYLNND